jgi:hypothetical protein
MDHGNLAHLTAFVAVVDRLSFRAAASQLGGLRTTCSVSVTDAGSGRGTVFILHRRNSRIQQHPIEFWSCRNELKPVSKSRIVGRQ